MPKDFIEEMMKEENRTAEKQDSVTPQPAVKPQPGRPKRGAAGALAAIAVVIFFIGDLYAMLKFAKTDPPLCVACLGLLFLVFGTVGLTQTKITWDTYPILIFPAVGALLTVLPIADSYSKKHGNGTIFNQHFMVAMAAAAFFIAGILMLILPTQKRKAMLQKCTEHVMAKCVYLDSHISHSSNHKATRVYAPKWEYTVGGEVYQRQETSYTNINVPSVGDECEILVDPEDPHRIYRDDPNVLKFMTFMGIAFAAAGILMVYFEFIA